MSRAATFLAAALLLGSFAAPVALGSDPLPYRLQVGVIYGKPEGPQSLRELMEEELVVAIRGAGCFRDASSELTGPREPSDLELAVSIHDYEDEASFDLTIAERSSTTAGPNPERQMVARVRAVIQLDLWTLADGAHVRQKRFLQRHAWRPIYSEDPREMVREELIEDVVRSTKRFVCKGTAKSWAKQLDKARAAAEKQAYPR